MDLDAPQAQAVWCAGVTGILHRRLISVVAAYAVVLQPRVIRLPGNRFAGKISPEVPPVRDAEAALMSTAPCRRSPR
jgi:hypothetical protein